MKIAAASALRQVAKEKGIQLQEPPFVRFADLRGHRRHDLCSTFRTAHFCRACSFDRQMTSPAQLVALARIAATAQFARRGIGVRSFHRSKEPLVHKKG